MCNINYLAETKVNEYKNDKAEKEKLIDTCKEMIAMYQDKILEYQNSIERLDNELKEFLFNIIPDEDFKETKTQLSYKFPSGQFIKKKPTKLIQLKQDCNMNVIPKEFIKIHESVNWIEYKKKLQIVDGNVIDKETGEIIDNCEIVNKPAEFRIKL